MHHLTSPARRPANQLRNRYQATRSVDPSTFSPPDTPRWLSTWLKSSLDLRGRRWCPRPCSLSQCHRVANEVNPCHGLVPPPLGRISEGQLIVSMSVVGPRCRRSRSPRGDPTMGGSAHPVRGRGPRFAPVAERDDLGEDGPVRGAPDRVSLQVQRHHFETRAPCPEV